MKRIVFGSLLLAVACAFARPAPARACGGFFCSASPVDQNAERILFAINEEEGTTDMIVQITYQGEDDAFAWVLPVGAVPQNRDVFPSMALSSLDSQTGPIFQPPAECQTWGGLGGFSGPIADAGISVQAEADGDVTVHVMETIDDFDVAVIESESAEASFRWLIDNGYRLSSVMKPYIELYTAQKMKFLALKLTAGATTQDIKPFRMTLPGTTPTIPLRLTALAAEPEMGVVVWVLGQRRYEPANAEEFDIEQEALRWRPGSWTIRTNWAELVARGVDERGGKAWVVEQAGSTAALAQAVENSFANAPEQVEAQEALREILTGRPYLTRLYTRVAAEEMSYDPTFRRSDKGDVPQLRELPHVEELCSADAGLPRGNECDFAACGQLGLCREVVDADTKAVSAACACAPGTSARTTFGPEGLPMVTCQDQRMSFMNPGEADEAGAKFTDPCVGYSCGEHGRCVAMNLTPTCECDEGYVAVGGLAADGSRETECVLPASSVPKSFYNRRPPALAAGMLAGRIVELPVPVGVPDMEMAEEYGDPMPPTTDASEEDGKSPLAADDEGEPQAAGSDDDSGCRVGAAGNASGLALLGVLLGFGTLRRRRRSS